MRPEPTPSAGLPATARPSAPRANRRPAITAAQTAARFASAAQARQLDREILTRIASGGLLICETELRYQLARRGHDRPDLLELLAGLEQRGLIESELHVRLTPAGAARVPVPHRPAPRAISSIPWAGGALGRTAARPARRAARWPRPSSTRGKASAASARLNGQ